MMSPIVINVPTRAFLVGKRKASFVRWLANLKIKRNLTSMFVNKYLPYRVCFLLLSHGLGVFPLIGVLRNAGKEQYSNLWVERQRKLPTIISFK